MDELQALRKMAWQRLGSGEKGIAYYATLQRTPTQIAEELFLSEFTVETVLEGIFAKLRIDNIRKMEAFLDIAKAEMGFLSRPLPITQSRRQFLMQALSQEELHIAQALAEGKTLSAISADLGMNVFDMKSKILRPLQDKLDAQSATHIISFIAPERFASPQAELPASHSEPAAP